MYIPSSSIVSVALVPGENMILSSKVLYVSSMIESDRGGEIQSSLKRIIDKLVHVLSSPSNIAGNNTKPPIPVEDIIIIYTAINNYNIASFTNG